MNKKHVFIIGSKGIPAQYGGYETFVEKLTKNQKDPSIFYHVACATEEHPKEFFHNGAHCFQITWKKIGAAKAIVYDIEALRYSIQYVKKYKIKKPIFYILACRIGPFLRGYKKEIEQLGGVLYVNPDGHEWLRAKWSAPVRKYWKLSEGLMVKYADLIICDSKNIESYIKETYQKYNPSTTYISYGAEITKSQLSDTDEKLTKWYSDRDLEIQDYYLVVGRFVPENNYEIMINEFMKSTSTKKFVLITNVNEDFLKVLQERTQYQADARIVFAGTVYDDELLQKIREHAYGYIHGHEVGGTNPSLLESLSCTRLNLLLDVGFNREVAEDAALYWGKASFDLAKTIEKADCMSKESIDTYAQKAKARIAKAYSWEFIVQEYETLFIKQVATMKILLINKFFYIKGGSETYLFALRRLLEGMGHEVIDFSMQDDRNLESKQSDYFVEHVDYTACNSLKKKMKMAVNIIYSLEAKKKLERLIRDTKPDIAHLQIFQHQLSPAIIDVLKKYNVPIVYTAHELKMICPNYKMLVQNKVCEQCKGGKYRHCLLNKCVKESYLKSLIATIEGYVHAIRKTYDNIGMVIAPSEFYRNKFVDFGVDAERIVHIDNFLDTDAKSCNTREDRQGYLLYFGRLSEEKGVLLLLEAMKDKEYPLYIIGSGVQEKALKQYAEEQNLQNVHFLGFRTGQDLVDFVGNARAVILPSIWYENGPYTAIESLQLGVPIIASDMGGIPELVDGNGYVYEATNIKKLQQVIQNMIEIDEDIYQAMCDRSKQIFYEKYAREIHWMKLEQVYKKVLE
ncbi:MAG: DUF1972 domain-containing protein [Lachnospiraceae bacterium]